MELAMTADDGSEGTAGWRFALPIARRSVRRHPGWSLPIIALVSLPVATATVVDGIVRTQSDRTILTLPLLLLAGLGLIGVVTAAGGLRGRRTAAGSRVRACRHAPGIPAKCQAIWPAF
jgi:hypothetical protein